MVDIFLVRHAQVDAEPALYGRTDIKAKEDENTILLTALTKQHNKNPFDYVISSPLQRCNTLAQQFSTDHQLPLECYNDFGEMDFGLLDGKSFDCLYQNNERLGQWSMIEAFYNAPADNTLPDGETLVDFNERVIQSWQQLTRFCLQSPNIKRVLLITHGGVIRIVLAHLLQLDWKTPSWHQTLKISNASMSRVNVSLENASVNSIGEQITSKNCFLS